VTQIRCAFNMIRHAIITAFGGECESGS